MLSHIVFPANLDEAPSILTMEFPLETEGLARAGVPVMIPALAGPGLAGKGIRVPVLGGG